MKVNRTELLMLVAFMCFIVPGVLIANLMPQHILAYTVGAIFGGLAVALICVAIVREVMGQVRRSR